MKYQTFPPIESLSALVKCYWTLEGPKKNLPEKQTIVPDGCVEMIFHYGDLYKQYLKEGKSIVQPRCFVIGQLTAPLEIEPMGQTGIFAVRFHPYGFASLTTLPLKELENNANPLKTLFSESGVELEMDILKATEVSSRIEIVEKFIMEKLAKTASIDRVIQSTLDLIISSSGQDTISSLSQKMKINRRQLERKFSAKVGLSPKQLSRIIRLQATLTRLLNDNYGSLTSLAYEEGFYDQAHFIREFKEFTGLTPKEFFSDNLKMSSLFYS